MSSRPSQRNRILKLLLESKDSRVPSPALARISLQYSARIRELRKLGYLIDNHTETVGGQKHGWFVLVKEPHERRSMAPVPSSTQLAPSLQSCSDENSGNGQQARLAPIGARVPSTFLDHEMGRKGKLGNA